jgi:hypothetical protein
MEDIAHGVATWYRYKRGQAAAGPALRAALGKHWRGKTVFVCVGKRCAKVRLTDWCACGDRNGVPTVIDLDIRTFDHLSNPARGVIRVTVSVGQTTGQ